MLPASLSARWLQKEFVEATTAGGACTVLAYGLMLIVFVLELSSFLGDTPESFLSLENDPTARLQINFNIDLYSIECQNLRVVVFDPIGNEPVRSLSRDYRLRTVDFVKDHDVGTDRGVHTQISGSGEDEDEHTKLAHKLEETDGKQELDSDWASSHDGFKHQHFDHVVEYHDFTVMNFFAEWCVHCRQFSPTWGEIAEEVSKTEYADSGGKKLVVKALKMNCVDFRTICRQQGINAFPTLRIYRSDGSLLKFEGPRSKVGILNWVAGSVRKEAGSFTRLKEYQTGCNVVGYLQVPRMPGYLELFSGAGDNAMDPSMTNASHFVRHLSFSDPRDHVTLLGGTWKSHGALSSDALKHTNPLDRRKFSTTESHQTYEHHLKLVSTLSSYGQAYQFSHYNRVSTSSNTSEVPQAKFNFDIETFSIKIQSSGKQWYDFGTSTMAILGGTFVMVKLMSIGTRSVAKVAARSTRGKRTGRAALDLLK